MTLTVHPATPEDSKGIMLRYSDFVEASEWMPGMDPYEALEGSIRTSDQAYTVREGDAIVAIFGLSLSTHEIHPWLMCSPLVSMHKKATLLLAKTLLEALQLEEPERLICNHVYKTNSQARRFLKYLGFRIVPTPGDGKFEFFYLPPPCA